MFTRISLCAIAALPLLLAACSGDSETAAGSASTSTTAGASSGGSNTTTSTTGGGEGGSAPGPGPGSEEIVINEFSVVGATEWLELANKGSAAFDLSDYGLADTDKTTQEPKVEDAMRFPPGTKIEAGGYILVLVSKKDLPPGPYTKDLCLPNGPESCFYATFGVSASTGETVHFLAPNNTVITKAAYPTTVAPDPLTQSACRVPDLTGEFAVCPQTPGAANAAP